MPINRYDPIITYIYIYIHTYRYINNYETERKLKAFSSRTLLNPGILGCPRHSFLLGFLSNGQTSNQDDKQGKAEEVNLCSWLPVLQLGVTSKKTQKPLNSLWILDSLDIHCSEVRCLLPWWLSTFHMALCRGIGDVQEKLPFCR